ncbi:MAG: DUF2382 domain-containing protein [Pseudomonadota bacterium]
MTLPPESNNASGSRSPVVGDRLVDAEGRQAQIVSMPSSEAEAVVVIRVDNGPEMLVPLDLLSARKEGAYQLPFAFASVTGHATVSEKIVIPVIQEELHVGTRVVDTGAGVRVHKTVTEREQLVDQTLLQDEIKVERIPVGKLVDRGQEPVMRYEGDTVVVPVLEEVLVVEKQLRLKEEVRITRHRREVRAQQQVALKSEQVSIERFDESGSPSPGKAKP